MAIALGAGYWLISCWVISFQSPLDARVRPIRSKDWVYVDYFLRLSGKSKLTAEVGENFSIKVITDKKKRSSGGQCDIRCTEKAIPQGISVHSLVINQKIRHIYPN